MSAPYAFIGVYSTSSLMGTVNQYGGLVSITNPYISGGTTSSQAAYNISGGTLTGETLRIGTNAGNSGTLTQTGGNVPESICAYVGCDSGNGVYTMTAGWRRLAASGWATTPIAPAQSP